MFLFISVHYTGTLLDGTKFDSSRDRGTPFKFSLGQGADRIPNFPPHFVAIFTIVELNCRIVLNFFEKSAGEVIKGWDEGIKTMKKGEQAVFPGPPELADGEAGSPPASPPNATLRFDVELRSWASVKDICKDGGIFKKVLAEGHKWENPKDLDEVLGTFQNFVRTKSQVETRIRRKFSNEKTILALL